MWPYQATLWPAVGLSGHRGARTDGRTDGRTDAGRTPGGRRAVRESLWPRVSTHTRTPKIATPPLRGEEWRRMCNCDLGPSKQ